MSVPDQRSAFKRWTSGVAFAFSTLALLATGPGGPEWTLAATITGPTRPAKADELLLLSFDTSHRPFVQFDNARGEARQIVCDGGQRVGQFTCALPPGAAIRGITTSARCAQGCSDARCNPPKSAYLRVTSEARSSWTRAAHLDARGTFAAITDTKNGYAPPSIEMLVDAPGAGVEMSLRVETLAHEPVWPQSGGGVTPALYGAVTPAGFAEGILTYDLVSPKPTEVAIAADALAYGPCMAGVATCPPTSTPFRIVSVRVR